MLRPVTLVLAGFHPVGVGIDHMGLVVGSNLSDALPPGFLPPQVASSSFSVANRQRCIGLLEEVLGLLRRVSNGRKFLGDRRDLFGRARGFGKCPQAGQLLFAFAASLLSTPRFLQHGSRRCLTRLEAVDGDGLLEANPFLVLQEGIIAVFCLIARALNVFGCSLCVFDELILRFVEVLDRFA